MCLTIRSQLLPRPARKACLPKILLLKGHPLQRQANFTKVILAQPGGFYAAAVRAIEIVGHALENYEPPVYVRNEIVHNGYGIER